MSDAAQYLRDQLGTVTTFDGMLNTVADAFDIESGELELVDAEDNDGEVEEEERPEPEDGPATDFATPQPTRTRRAPPRRKRRR